MTTRFSTIRVEKRVKEEAAVVFATFGLSVSDAVNGFLRETIAARGTLAAAPKEYPARTVEERRAALHKLFELADRNPVLPKDYKFNREECYDRAIFRR